MARIQLAADFKDFLSLCLSHEVRFMVIGGYAVVHYSRPRYTGDLDIWIDASLENAQRVVAVLHDFGLTGADITTEMITGQKQIIRMGFEPMRLELFTRIPALQFQDCYERREFVKIGKMSIPLISLEDLKTNKRKSGRPKDLQDLEELP
jgi:predicted nucleotidyltransferase